MMDNWKYSVEPYLFIISDMMPGSLKERFIIFCLAVKRGITCSTTTINAYLKIPQLQMKKVVLIKRLMA